MLQFILHKTDPSNRLYVLVLDLLSHTFFKIKISSPQEIIDRSIERKYKSPLKNGYMVFMTDCSEAFKVAKSEKKFRQNSECFKDFPSLWNDSTEEIKNEYDRVFKASKRKNFEQFVHYNPQNGNNEQITNIQPASDDNGTNDSVSACDNGLNSYSTINSVGTLFTDSSGENDSNSCPPVDNTEILLGRAETLSSLGENNANSPIVDNLITLLEGNNNNLNNYFMVDNTENLLGRSSLIGNNANNLDNYFIVDNMGNLISPLRGNNLNNYFIVDNMGNLISPLRGNNLNNYFIVDNMGNVISPLGRNNLDNYFIVDNMGNLINSLGDNNLVLEADNGLNNRPIVNNTGNLIIDAIDDQSSV